MNAPEITQTTENEPMKEEEVKVGDDNNQAQPEQG